ncbi:CxxxxCH/CxxCH domain-containing protein [Geobacter sp. DSM 9736]|uniref:multiheme c-type cytochrome n=1 Tax=Geobacter sp. DSM 9736 TaxID=1277350 RepID=UPI000B50E437|nr:CxxxxCH/CxxCH domain-containing protein [Geobacter sp. DSM 9736]SNB47898.1 Geobacter sulfurreducens CxxxxCH...CXXCH domain-containing protein [Geobacter sp. DSM 9736]
MRTEKLIGIAVKRDSQVDSIKEEIIVSSYFRRMAALAQVGLLALCLVVAISGAAQAAQYSMTCASCHGMPPLDDTTRNIGTGAFQGNHQTHQPAVATATDCAMCHNVTGFHNGHMDGRINLQPNVNNSPATAQYRVGGAAVAFKNQTSVPVLGSCSNANCHFERQTPVWGSPKLGARSEAVCSTCHDAVPTTDAHAKHTAFIASKNSVPAADTCNSCHVTNYGDAAHAFEVGRAIKVQLASGKYSTATKASYLPSQQSSRVAGDCSNLYCHSNGAGSFTKPNWGTPASGACGTCHANPPVTSTHQTFGAAANNCSTCHIDTDAAHVNTKIDKSARLTSAPHFNNVTTGSYPASYITSRSACADCHNTTAGNQTIRQQWAGSGHGTTTASPWVSSDFKTRSGCVQCHTTTGFVAFSSAKKTSAWGVASDKTKETITCRACHSDEATGAVRMVTPAKTFSSYTAFRNADMRTSNICADCHSGRDAANRRVAVMTNFSTAMSYGAHYLPAAGTVQGITGYAFPGRSYTLADNSHSKAGTLNANNTGTDGPCVTCHMTATDKHTFGAVTTDAGGAITGIKTTICTNCHSSSLPAATLDAKRVAFNNAMDVLKAAFADKGIIWNSTSKTFNTTTGGTVIKWGLKTGNEAARNKYGAAYNYRLFYADPAAYTHNPAYARQLIIDSIDAAYNNGIVTGDITAALADLVNRGKITQVQADSVVAYKSPTASCNGCHGNPPATTTHTAFGTAANTCSTCHVFTGVNGETHLNGTVNKTALLTSAPHFNNLTGAKFPASYITTQSTCADCHNTTANNKTIRQQWAGSSHGDTTGLAWINYDFKTRAGCVQCHTTTGFVTFSTARKTSAWGVASDKSKETLTCRGCHSDVASGAVRNVTRSNPFDVETTYQNVEMSTSNICSNCHSGRNNGVSIQSKVGTSDFTNLAFISPHYLSAAGSVQGKTAFHFPGRTYTGFADNAHGKVGMGNANGTGTTGPCVACHMTSGEKHTFEPISTASNGAITKITSTSCTKCHNTSLPAVTLDTKRVDFNSALNVLRAALAARTPAIIVTDAYPYVSNRNWGTGQAGANLMGATFNLKLFITEPGAYAHNPAYAKQIIADSIEAAVTGGTVTGDLNTALATLVTRGTITQPQADSVLGYRDPEGSCATCHGNPPATTTHTAFGTAANTCSTCHVFTGVNGETHLNGTVNKTALLTSAPHFNNLTGAKFPASYITTQSTCADCHNTTANNKTIRQQWAGSSHGDTTGLAWINYDFKTRAGCVQCHTTTGFVTFSTARKTSAWGVASDKSKETLTCRGCHSDVASGAVRNVTRSNPFDVETTYQNVEMSTSNICSNCHSGRNNGVSIQSKVGTSDFTNLAFISPHYLSAAGSVQGKTAFHFPGRTYTGFADNAHGKVGMGNANGTGTTGPCVACHMTSGEKHTFEPISTASNGAITKITSTSCTKCHNTSLPAVTLDTKRVDFNSALNVLRAALAARTPAIIVTDAYPYVSNRNWGTGQAGANLMGATFNLKLFITEPGAYAHNPAYAKQIIADSIEAAVMDGTVTGDLNTALATLVTRGTITQAQADSVLGYKNPEGSCTTCHGNPPNNDTHLGIVAGTCASCHEYTGVNGATHNNGTVDMNATGGSCDACHGYPPAPRKIAEGQTLVFGKQGQWSSARFEDYSGGGGAHLVAAHINPGVKPSDGWAPCLTCHVDGSAAHARTLPVKYNVSNVTVKMKQNYKKFNVSQFITYSGAKLSNPPLRNTTGSCYNSSCHFKQSPQWSIER